MRLRPEWLLPLGWCIFEAYSTRRSTIRGSGAVEEILSGWTNEALCVILCAPRAESAERSSVHDGMKNVRSDMRKRTSVADRVVGWLEEREGCGHDILPQVRNPTDVSRMASG